MSQLLNNPVYHAAVSGEQHLSFGTEKVRFFEEAVSPFVGIADGYADGFDELFSLLPAGRTILHASIENIAPPVGWELIRKIKGVQMVFSKAIDAALTQAEPVLLQGQHIAQMMQLAELTRPGPFGKKTIEFGHYYGIFEQNKLAAMAGQRLHVKQFTEISAVCTHPAHLGKGYASVLLQHQVALIRRQRRIPFLHVIKDNVRAIALYERIGFAVRGPMNFYFMKRRSRKRV